MAEEFVDYFDRAPCGYHSLDAEGRYLHVNDAELELLGYARAELLGCKRVQDLLTAESLTRFNEQFPKFKKSGVVRNLPLDFVHKNGAIVPVIVNATAVFDERGHYVASRSVITDMSAYAAAQRKREQALRDSEERYRAVVEDQTEIICRLLADGTFVFVNDVYCRFFDKPASTLIGTQWQPLAVAEDLPHIEEKLRTLSPDNPVVTIENRVYNAAGNVRWMQFVNRGFFGEDGALREIQCVGRDITKRKQIEAALREANDGLEIRVAERTRQLRQLTYDVAKAEEQERRAIARDLHDDLGQLLHIARIKLDALANVASDPVVLGFVHELGVLTSDASARVRSLTAQLNPPVLETLGLIAAIRWLGEEMEQNYGMTVEVEDDGTPKPLTQVQATILYRAVRELLINVAKHAKTLYAVVETRVDNHDLVIRISDEGIGIKDESAALAGQSGFGLASIAERIGALGGSTIIDSGENRGTSVTLRVPFDFGDAPPGGL